MMDWPSMKRPGCFAIVLFGLDLMTFPFLVFTRRLICGSLEIDFLVLVLLMEGGPVSEY